jgi:alpha-galactosidase
MRPLSTTTWRFTTIVFLQLLLPLVWAADTPKSPLPKPQVTVHVNSSTGTIDLIWANGSKVSNITSRCELEDGRILLGAKYPEHAVTHLSGSKLWTIRHTGAGLSPLTQHIWEVPGEPWVEMDAEIEGDLARIGSRHFEAAMISGKDTVHLEDAKILYALHVPYDNDMWFRFSSNMLTGSSQEVTSNEVSAIFDNESRHAIVFGSITHDMWKTAINIHASNGDVDSIDIFGGLQGPSGEKTDTHDFVPHGLVKGMTVRSPKIMIGAFDDWRNGLEAYGRRNAELHPPLPWAGPRPLGWNSWAAYANKINHQRFIGAAQFLHDKLEPEGFSRSVIYVSFDAFWSNLDAISLADAASTVSSLKTEDGSHFEPGIYWTPFATWTNDLDSFVEGTNGKYRYRDILLKGPDGNFLPKVDGGWPIDPTHPGARMRTRYTIAKLQQLGFKLLKLDFLSHGALEGVHYDPSIVTGTQAYNFGMQDVVNANGGRMYLSLSIAPLFPAGYGNARRLSCDVKGHMSGKDQSTEYMLNSLTYGWWTDGSLYTADPDEVPLGAKADQGSRNLVEARSRLLSAVVSGGMILDSTRLADDPEGQQLAKQVYAIPQWMKIAAEGKIFRPLEGDTGDAAANIFVRSTAHGYYVAVFNYDEKQAHSIAIDQSRIDPAMHVTSAHDIVSGKEVPSLSSRLMVDLAPSESRLIEITTTPTRQQ